MQNTRLVIAAVFLLVSSWAVNAQEADISAAALGDKPFVLIARLHALPDQVDKVIALSRQADERVKATEPGMLLHTFDRDPADPLGFVWTEVYAHSAALVFHLENPDLIAYLDQVSPLLDIFTVELYGEVAEAAVEQLRATGTPTIHYQTELGFIRDLTP